MSDTVAGFHDVIFPVPVARGARVTTQRQTDIVTLGSGFEERNARWRYAKRTYDGGGGVRSLDDLRLVLQFFEARMGQLYAFRFRDPLDHSSSASAAPPDPADQVIGVGDGLTTTFALQKTYASGNEPRPIRLPVPGSVSVAVDGSPIADLAVNDLAGTVTFDAGAAPALGAVITAGYYFDVPCRFDTPALDVDLTAFAAGSLPTIPLKEVFLREAVNA